MVAYHDPLSRSQRKDSPFENRRSRNLVRLSPLIIYIVQEPRVVRRVEGRGRRATRVNAATTRHLDVDALRVRLRSANVLQGNELVAQDILARRKVRRDLSAPLHSVREHLVRAPEAGVGTRNQAGFLELEELKRGGVDVCELALDFGEISHAGPVVAFGPGAPLEFDGAACGNGSGDGAGFSASVADYVWAVETVGGNEAVVSDFCAPADCLGGIGHVRVDIADPAAVPNCY